MTVAETHENVPLIAQTLIKHLTNHEVPGPQPLHNGSSEGGLNITTEEEPSVERKLVAILAADIEGYSRLMHEDEASTLATLSSHRAICDNLIASFNGRVTASAGDSIVAEFASVTDSVTCAVAIQQHIHKANRSLPLSKRMLFRIGINVGDIMVKEGDIYGDDVNVAARVEGLAAAGGICVTRAVRDQLRDRLEYEFEDLGEKKVKNISRPIRTFRVLFDAEGGLTTNQAGNAGDTKPDSPEPLDPVAVNIELTFWNSVKDSSDPAMLEAYLEKYPEGEFKPLAEIQLSKLRSESQG
jgi:adenylate cyclase